MERQMNKNPFSIYDFLGYLFPGAFGLIILRFVWYADNPLCVECLVESLNVWISGPSRFDGTLLFILFSYIAGHIIAYASTWTVESFANWKYGYPSYALLGITTSYFEHRSEEQWDNNNLLSRRNLKCFGSCLFRLLIGIFVFPISILSELMGRYIMMKKYYIKELDVYTKKAFLMKLQKMCKELGLDVIVNIDNKETDFHRLVSFYEYEYCKKHGTKMDNYVAIYDFMRSLCLIFNVFTGYILIKSLFVWELELANFIWVIGFSLMTYFLFMAYMKFYRRYTHESFITLIIDKDL